MRSADLRSCRGVIGKLSCSGAAGLTLGGGFGRLARKFGMACDNLIGAEVITASRRNRVLESRRAT